VRSSSPLIFSDFATETSRISTSSFFYLYNEEKMDQYKVLTEKDIEAIHAASLRVLAETGITLTHPEAREIFAGAGATILSEKILIPPWLVEQEITKSTTKVRIRGRGGSVRLGIKPYTGTTWVEHVYI
jgi:trimethylamine--corrinoid protein Co-methyltransferase